MHIESLIVAVRGKDEELKSMRIVKGILYPKIHTHIHTHTG